ncbi:GNAT family N-acetyltransferase [Flavobacterium supellecticarium]|uniref:GNAT family N-acetyltransferase n=1 Tax=Flavobacterium supellecticarium TaxID=2565924 RepID=A0A4S4A3D0_9FLAO|nr:GNAT family N-acetyltransferase [Flavobacterium supellecticarium]THF52788.1 GNAT family N-acetyltransferase [Flavobacterium supellecticarium]
MPETTYKLDNPVYYSLTETHQPFALELDGILYYHPDFGPFGGFIPPLSTEKGVAHYARLTDNFFIVGEKPSYDHTVNLVKELVCDQMVLSQPIALVPEHEIVTLGGAQKEALLALVNLVQPGYFKTRTPEMGNYYGIFKEGVLVAVTGERMKMEHYTEISAVVTHPEHTGKGYASQLVAHAAHRIFLENKTPYLHVASSNTRAIAVYEKLRFKTRRKISFWNLTAQ